MNYIYVQGKLTEVSSGGISIFDRSFKFGDGIFETLRIENGKIFNFPFHEMRLKAGLAALKIAFDASEFKKVCDATKPQSGILRVHISRGEGSKGYLPQMCQSFAVIEVKELTNNKENISLHIASQPAHIFAKAKTASSLNYVLAAIEAAENGADNALLLDKNIVCECANANIFWVKNNKLFTPALDLPLINGSVQNIIMQNFEVTQAHLPASELINQDEIFVTNTNLVTQNIAKINGYGNIGNIGFATKVKEFVSKSSNFS